MDEPPAPPADPYEILIGPLPNPYRSGHSIGGEGIHVDAVISILVRALEVIFILGVLGSAMVLILTSIEDIQELLLGKDSHESEGSAAETRRPSGGPRPAGHAAGTA
jgi:hypothetical protein